MAEGRTSPKIIQSEKKRGQSVDLWQQQKLKGRGEEEVLVKEIEELPDK